MLAKKTYKNQITLPRAIAEQFKNIEYFDIAKQEGNIILSPVEMKSVSKTLLNVREKIEALGLTEKDINSAIKWARGKKH